MFRNINNQRRTAESPMDFEWQSSSGPTDPNSPFPQYKPGQGSKSNFASPVKSSFVGASSTPAPPFRNPSFTTPRKPFEADLFSEVSGAESSPADNADAEDTPDYPKSSKTMTTFPTTPGPIKQPLFGRYGAGFQGSSPGRADIRRGKLSNTIVQKARRRRRIDKDLARRDSRDDSDYDSDESRKSRPKSREKKSPRAEERMSWFASFFNYIDAHPNLPNVLSYWAQMAINLFIALLTIFGIATFWTTIRSDVDKASEDARSLVFAEMQRCATDFVRNGCQSSSRPPALETVCHEWEHCMNQNPDNVGRARVSAHTFAEIFNSFIEPISYKAMIFIFFAIAMAIIVNNLAFSSLRSRNTPPPPHNAFFPQNQNQNFQWGNPPQTPSHRDMNYDALMGEPYRSIMPSGTPGRALNRSPSKSSMRSPSKDW